MTGGTVSGLLNDEGSGFALFVHVAQARQGLLSGADALAAGLCCWLCADLGYGTATTPISDVKTVRKTHGENPVFGDGEKD